MTEAKTILRLLCGIVSPQTAPRLAQISEGSTSENIKLITKQVLGLYAFLVHALIYFVYLQSNEKTVNARFVCNCI